MDIAALAIVDSLYEAALGERDWDQTLGIVADFCGAGSAALVRADHLLQQSSVLAPRADPAVIAAYTERWWVDDPTLKATSAAAVGRITSLADTGRDVFYNSAFFNEFWSASALGSERFAANLALGKQRLASCVLHASATRDELDNAAEARFALLLPHFVRALAIETRLQRLALRNILSTGLDQGGRLGLLVVDSAARVLYADTAVEALLSEGAGIHLRGGRFQLRDPLANERLLHAIGACVGRYRDLPLASDIPWHRGPGAEPLSIEVVPAAASATVLPVAGATAAAVLIVRRRLPARARLAPMVNDGSDEASGAAASAPTRAELFARITRDIAANLGQGELSLAWLADRHGVTTRRIRDLFYGENTNFTDYVLNARLDLAADRLRDPEQAHINIASIALDCGFGDISWFHHTFRRRFRMTPAAMRESARRV